MIDVIMPVSFSSSQTRSEQFLVIYLLMMRIWLNDRLVPEDRASVSVFDHGFLYGDGIYETLLARDGIVLKLNAHLDRLRRSASLIGLRLPYAKKELGEIVYRTIGKNKLSDAYIRITVSRGSGPIGLDPALCPSPTLVVICRPFMRPPKEQYRKGVKLIVSRTRRNARDAVNPEIKSLNFLNNILAKIEAKKGGAFEAVMLNQKGFVTEGTISNIFMVKGGTLLTPSVDSGILEGITRNMVIDAARDKGVPVSETAISRAALSRADEVFITNTSMGIMPVHHVDAIRYKSRKITDLLSGAYEDAVEKEILREKKKRRMTAMRGSS